MSTLFSQIYKQEIPGFVVAENDASFVIVDKYPIQLGHLLVIPKQEVANLFDLDDQTYSSLLLLAKQVAQTLKQITKAEKIGVIVEGYGIKDHAHLHLVPLFRPGQLDMNQSHEISDSDMATLASQFKQVWENNS